MGSFKLLSKIEKYMKALNKQVSGVTRDRLLKEEIADIKAKASNKPFNSLSKDGIVLVDIDDNPPPSHFVWKSPPDPRVKSPVSLKSAIMDTLDNDALKMITRPNDMFHFTPDASDRIPNLQGVGVLGTGGGKGLGIYNPTAGPDNNLKAHMDKFKGTRLQPIVEAVLGCKDPDSLVAINAQTLTYMLEVVLYNDVYDHDHYNGALYGLKGESDQPDSNGITVKCDCGNLIPVILDKDNTSEIVEGRVKCDACERYMRYRLTTHTVDLDDHKKINKDLLKQTKEELDKIIGE